MATRRKRNVEQGFYDATGFHPIRASRDYDDAVDYDSEQRGRGGYRRRNVEQGFYDATGFHPIRASRDYDDSVDYDSESYSRSTRGYGRRNPPKKKRNFSPAQLRAQRAFAKMAKARAKAAKAAKRVMKKAASKRRPATKRAAVKRNSKTTTLTVTKNGRKLYGAAAQAVLAARVKRNPKMRKVKKGSGRTPMSARRLPSLDKFFGKIGRAGKKKPSLFKKKSAQRSLKKRRNGVFRTAARRAIGRRLSAPIRFGRKRNSTTPPAIQRVHKMFLGRESTKTFSIKAPNGTPGNVAVLGPLVCLKTKDETFEFSRGEAYVATDGQAKKLYILGDKYAGQLEPNTNLGPITEIRYEARKDHINPLRWKRRRRNSQVTEYFHFFGEENGKRPKLQTDRDRLLHITGGDYKIRAEGIVN